MNEMQRHDNANRLLNGAASAAGGRLGTKPISQESPRDLAASGDTWDAIEADMYGACASVLNWLKTGESPADGCVAAPPPESACREMLEAILSRYEAMKSNEPDSSEGSIGEMLARGEFDPMEPVFGHPKGPVVAKLEAQVKVTDVDGVLEYVKHLADELEYTENQLGIIRATLIVNFGERQPGNRYGFTVKDAPEKTTSNLLIEVLGELAGRLLREEREGMQVIEERDAAQERLDILTAQILQEDIDWPCHEAKWDEAQDEISRIVQAFRDNGCRAEGAADVPGVPAVQEARPLVGKCRVEITPVEWITDHSLVADGANYIVCAIGVRSDKSKYLYNPQAALGWQFKQRLEGCYAGILMPEWNGTVE